MSLKTKVVTCALTMLAAASAGALVPANALREYRDAAAEMYDRGIAPVAALRRTQASLAELKATLLSETTGRSMDSIRKTVAVTGMKDAFDALDAFPEGVGSARLREHLVEARRLTLEIVATGGGVSVDLLSRHVDRVNALLDASVRDLEAGTAELRGGLAATGDEATLMTRVALALAFFVALATIIVLWRSIVPSINNAVRVARQIGEADLGKGADRPVVEGEGELLKTLAQMQESIEGQFRRIEDDKERQANRHVREMAEWKTWVDAALNTMSQGICLLDSNYGVRVTNGRFQEIFGDARGGVEAGVLRDLLRPNEGGSFNLTRGGRVVSVSRRGVGGGALLITAEDISERHVAEVKLERMARHDALTDLANRVEFRDRLDDLLENHRVAVLFLDLDRFKDVNDTLGHPVGDALLREVAERLRAVVDKDDIVARLGGDEFAIIQVATEQPEAAEKLATAVIHQIGRQFTINRNAISIGVSIGIVLSERRGPQRIESADSMIKNGDLALYAAKEGGRNTHRFYDPAMSERIERRRALEADLRVAMAENQLQLHYQPFFDADRGRATGFEALIRWKHPERGMVSPAEFVPIAEEFGMIEDIGDWALRTACAEATRWPEHLTVSVNLSPLQFKRKSLVADVRSALAESGLPPHRLWIEVTESLMLEDVRLVQRTLNSFKEIGVNLAMDDFGTGYSSLGHLSKFPFDKVKIDQSFVRDLDDAGKLEIVRAVIRIGEAMNLNVIAEGVETAEQRDALRKEGCVEMQGYFFGRPMPSAEVAAYITDEPRQRSLMARAGLRLVAG